MRNALIDKSKTALVVIDLQRGIVGRPTTPYASDIVEDAFQTEHRQAGARRPESEETVWHTR